MELTPNQASDVTRLEQVMADSKQIFIERMSKYGNSWREMKVESIADHIRMKAYRTAELGLKNDKAFDECKDIINYAAMLYMRLEELIEKHD